MMIRWFKKNRLYRYLIITLVLSISAVWVYAASVPYPFQSGNPASASQVNANFDYLAERSWERDTGSNDLYYTSGNVGIGTASPDRKLHIQSGDSNAAIILDRTGTEAGKWAIGISHTDASNYGSFYISNEDVRTDFWIDKSTGNVGIGTTSPEAKLHVDSTSYGMSEGIVISRDQEHSGAIYLSSDGDMILGKRNQSDQLVLDETGNVGIGTTSPDRKLVVNGGCSLFTFTPTAGEGGGGRISLCTPSDGTGISIGDTNTYRADLRFNDSILSLVAAAGGIPPSTNGISITTSGNVGIGTTSPAGKLDVNGSIYQRGSSLHADYVFENDYELESIREHAEFMWKNKHLKGIPKAKVDENGMEIVEVGSHRKGIVEELEKAHIYIEQLEGELRKQKREFDERLAKLEALLNAGQ